MRRHAGKGFFANCLIYSEDLRDDRLSRAREPQSAHATIGRMGAPLDEPFVVELIQHAHQGDRLQVEPGCDFGLAHPFVAGDVEHDRRLPPCDKQAGLSRFSVEAALDQPRDDVHQDPKISPDPQRFRVLDQGLDLLFRPDLIRRHDAPPPGLV